MPNHFDEVAKALASNSSRREALRRLGGGLLVAFLTPLGLSKAWAAPGGGRGRGCGVLCQAATGFDPKDKASKEAFKECVEACEACKESGGTSAIQEGGAVICDCPPPLEACNGVCFEPCPEGQTRNPETCECEQATGCSEGFVCGEALQICGSEENGLGCLCTASVEGPTICGNNFFCDTTAECTTSAECVALFGPGYFCQSAGTGCCDQVCVPPCGTLPPSSLGLRPLGGTNSGS
jgi:hypothetical protein